MSKTSHECREIEYYEIRPSISNSFQPPVKVLYQNVKKPAPRKPRRCCSLITVGLLAALIIASALVAIILLLPKDKPKNAEQKSADTEEWIAAMTTRKQSRISSTKKMTEKPTQRKQVDSQWSSWSHCSLSCGHGVRHAFRQMDNNKHERKSEGCMSSKYCPFTPWSSWSLCCNGKKTARRVCGDIEVGCGPGLLSKKEECWDNTQNCGQDIVWQWTDWTPWSSCTTSCGPEGVKRSKRSCISSQEEENNLKCEGRSSREISCDNNPCVLLAHWSSWSSWSQCSASCGGGIRTSTRTCVYPDNDVIILNCEGNMNLKDEYCNLDPCPIHGQWTDWSWSPCSNPCGSGERLGVRECTNPAPQFDGDYCYGNSQEVETCYDTSDCTTVTNYPASTRTYTPFMPHTHYPPIITTRRIWTPPRLLTTQGHEPCRRYFNRPVLAYRCLHSRTLPPFQGVTTQIIYNFFKPQPTLPPRVFTQNPRPHHTRPPMRRTHPSMFTFPHFPPINLSPMQTKPPFRPPLQFGIRTRQPERRTHPPRMTRPLQPKPIQPITSRPSYSRRPIRPRRTNAPRRITLPRPRPMRTNPPQRRRTNPPRRRETQPPRQPIRNPVQPRMTRPPRPEQRPRPENNNHGRHRFPHPEGEPGQGGGGNGRGRGRRPGPHRG